MFLTCVVLAFPLPQQPVAAVATRLPDSGFVLAGAGAPGVRGFGLGDGGVAAGGGALEVEGRGRVTTPGGVEVYSRSEGTRLQFPGGGQLLLAPDGYVHSRDGDVAGPFRGGVELLLGDGSRVCFDLGSSRRSPITEVTVAAGGRTVQTWKRRDATAEAVRARSWSGERLLSVGDGTALYRPLALGPLVTLELVLGRPAPRDGRPAQRLALSLQEFTRSIEALLERNEREVSPEVNELRRFLARREDVLAVDGHMPPRTASNPLTWQLGGGYELRLLTQGVDVRLQLAQAEAQAFAQWHLGYGANVHAMADGNAVGHSVAVPRLSAELLSRVEQFEIGPAIRVIESLRRGR